MGTHSFWRGARLRAPVAVLASVLAGIMTLTANALPASALGNPVLVTITVSPTAVSVPAGQTEQFSATGHYSDLSTKDLTDVVTWSTSSGSTATISNSAGSQGLATAVSTGLATVTATEGSTFGTAALTVLPAVLIAVTVSPSVTSIPLGETAPLNAVGHYSDGSTKNLTKSVTWATSASSVATVSNTSGSQGEVTAAGTGLADITATDPSSSLSGFAAVTVLPAALLAITVSPPASNIPAGEAVFFTATGLYSNASTQDITDSVTWSSSNTADATVSNSPGSQGEVTAITTGATTITATDPTTSIEGTALVTVLPAVLVAITVSPPAASIPTGETQQFTATGVYSDASTQNLTDSVTWSSSATSVATVSNATGSQGLATAIGTGPSAIAATDPASSISGHAVLTVLPAVLVAITVTPPLASVPNGDTQQMTAMGLYSSGTTANITDSVTWASSDTSVAKVSNKPSTDGVVTAVGTGGATITATDPTTSVEGVAAVTVLPAVLVAITVSPLAGNVPAGETEQFSATGLYSDGTTADITDSVTWASSETSYATVSNSAGTQGVVTGMAIGASTITATDPATSIEGVAAVTVLPAVLVAVTVSPLAANVPAGETKQFTTTGLYSDATTQNLTDSVTWSSSETSYATVSNSAGTQGLATGVAIGASTIIATDPATSIAGIAAVTVLPAVLLAITVTPVEASVALHATQQFTATGHYSDLSTQDLTDSATWSSSDTGEASISNAAGSEGLATGLATGQVVITATDPSSEIAGVAALDVTGPAITLSPSSGPVKTHVVVDGQGFTPGEKVVIHFRTGVSTEPVYTICTAVVSGDGTFSCKGKIRGPKQSGAPGLHKVNAKVPHVHGIIASTEFTLT